MYVNVIFLCFVLSEVFCGVINDLYKVDIIHYNDFHARFEETTLVYPLCSSNDTQCLGGFARLYQGIQSLLKEKPNALVLNAGDVFQGTYWYTLMKWNVTQKFINLIPNDAHAIGNHEYDDGPAGLAPYLAGLRAPVLAANMDTSKEPSLEGLYKPHIVVERNGRKIGIIGLITPQTSTSSNSRNVIFIDPVETAEKEAKLLTEKGVDIIIVLSHCGLDVDKAIAKEVGENIDIIVGGHSHSLLWNGDPPSKEASQGTYPVIEKSSRNPQHENGHSQGTRNMRPRSPSPHLSPVLVPPSEAAQCVFGENGGRGTGTHTALNLRSVRSVLIVTASAYTKYLGNLTVYFDRLGNMKSYEGEPVYLNRSIPEDPEIKLLLQPYAEYLHSVATELIGYADDDFLDTKCGAGECALGDLIADSLLYTVKQLNSSNLPHVSFLIRNMIRGSIGHGNITRGALINVLPFTNKVVTLVLPGKYIVKAMEHGMETFWQQKPFNGPWMPQVAGMNVTLNAVAKTAKVLVKQGEEFVALDPDQDYQVITMDFLTRGGNGFTMLKEHGRNITLIGKDVDIVENYIKKFSPIKQKMDNRLTVLN